MEMGGGGTMKDCRRDGEGGHEFCRRGYEGLQEGGGGAMKDCRRAEEGL